MDADDKPTANDLGVASDLHIHCHHYGSRAVIELNGELDMSASSQLIDRLKQLLPEGVSSVEIDAARVTFTDSSGLRAVLWARTEAHTLGVDFQVTAVSPQVERVIKLAGLRQVLLS